MDERISEEERKEVEKLLYELSNLQVRASVVMSKNAKGVEFEENGFDSIIQLDGEPKTLSAELNDIVIGFSTTTQKLSKLLNSPAIEKTMNKLNQSNVYNREMVGYYLDQLAKEMKAVSEKTRSIIDSETLKIKFKEEQEKQEREEEKKKSKEVRVSKTEEKPEAKPERIEKESTKLSK